MKIKWLIADITIVGFPVGASSADLGLFYVSSAKLGSFCGRGAIFYLWIPFLGIKTLVRII